MADRADLAHFIRQGQKRRRAGKQQPLKINAQAIAHDRDAQIIHRTGKLPDLIGAQKLRFVNEDTSARPRIHAGFYLGEQVFARAERVGILRDPDAAQAVIDEVESATAAVAAALPELEGATYSFANYLPGDSIYVVADPDDGASQFFSQLGLEIAPELLAVADGVTGRAQLSLEQADLLAADLVMVLPNGGDPVADLIGFADIPAVADGAYVEADLALAIALNTPSARSLLWALDQIMPGLEAVEPS